jgi:hypothetical protein
MKTADYQVFISFKNNDASGKPTPDAAAARKVYEALRAAEVRVFFSEESLAETGRGGIRSEHRGSLGISGDPCAGGVVSGIH